MSKNLFQSNIFFSFILISLVACTFSSRKPKKPNFSIDSNIIKQNIQTIVKCEEIEFNGVEKNVDGQVNAELAIKIINEKDLNLDENQQGELAEQIAKSVKQSLKDVNDYDIYKVMFISKEHINNYLAYVYKNEDLH